MLIFVIWIGLSLLVAISGKDKKIGYWGVFFLSLSLFKNIVKYMQNENCKDVPIKSSNNYLY